MKYYIASSLSNRKTVQELDRWLQDRGHLPTFPWWTEPPVATFPVLAECPAHGVQNTESRWYKQHLQERSMDDLQGVIDADFVIVMLPGGNGTHVELGAALALQRHGQCAAILYVPDGVPTEPYPCVFHWDPALRRASTMEELIQRLRDVEQERVRVAAMAQALLDSHR